MLAALSDRVTRWILLGTFGYGLLYLFWYWGTPLGQSPVLDGAENMLIAEAIANGTLPPEPFFRAMLYPCLISVFYMLGFSSGATLMATQLLGLVLHAMSTSLIYTLTYGLFKNRYGALFSTLLFGFNPILIYFAVDPYDITLGTFLFICGLCGILPLLNRRDREEHRNFYKEYLSTGLFLGLATLVRPHFLVVYLATPFILGFTLLNWRETLRSSLIILVAGAAVLCCGGVIQYAHAGVFRIMPWQGAYNLWAANKPGANGKFFKQEIFIEKTEIHANPAKIESLYLYLNETETQPPVNIDEMNHYWRKKFQTMIASHPEEWRSLMTRKFYYLFNNYEQYSNKTCSLHKRLSPWLRFNPIGWGLLLILSAGGCLLGFRSYPREWRLIIALSAVYAAGVLIFYVSSRFRLPLMSLLVLGSSVWASLPLKWKKMSLTFKSGFIAVIVFVSGVTYSNFFDAQDEATFIQDYLLLANAAARLGWDETAHH